MLIFSNSTIHKSCKFVRKNFPATFVLKVFKDILGVNELNKFPQLKIDDEYIAKSKKTGVKLSIKGTSDISSYFSDNQDSFLTFLKLLTVGSLNNNIITKILLDEFISQTNVLLLKDAYIKIDEDYKAISKWVPNREKREIFLNVDVPEYIVEYFTEGLDCASYKLHRSAILFCTFTLEASLRFKYTELNNKKSDSLRFYQLIDWAINEDLIEENEFNKTNIDFIRKYRNKLAHLSSKEGISTKQKAKEMSAIIIHLTQNFINSVFHE